MTYTNGREHRGETVDFVEHFEHINGVTNIALLVLPFYPTNVDLLIVLRYANKIAGI